MIQWPNPPTTIPFRPAAQYWSFGGKQRTKEKNKERKMDTKRRKVVERGGGGVVRSVGAALIKAGSDDDATHQI